MVTYMTENKIKIYFEKMAEFKRAQYLSKISLKNGWKVKLLI